MQPKKACDADKIEFPVPTKFGSTHKTTFRNFKFANSDSDLQIHNKIYLQELGFIIKNYGLLFTIS